MNEKTKRTLVIIGIFLIFAGRLYLKLPNTCSLNCKSIQTENDFISCLDACAINTTFKIPFHKLFTLTIIVILGFILFTHLLEHIFIKKTPQYVQLFSKLKSFFNIRNKYLNDYNYIKIEED